jgi:hypothetical protein
MKFRSFPKTIMYDDEIWRPIVETDAMKRWSRNLWWIGALPALPISVLIFGPVGMVHFQNIIHGWIERFPFPLLSLALMLPATLLMLLGIFFFREGVRILFVPHFWNATIFVRFKNTVLSMFFDGEMSRNRRVAIVAMPFLVPTVLAFAVHLAFRSESIGSVAWLIAWFSLALSGYDIGTMPMLVRLPRDATLYHSIWKPAGSRSGGISNPGG